MNKHQKTLNVLNLLANNKLKQNLVAFCCMFLEFLSWIFIFEIGQLGMFYYISYLAETSVGGIIYCMLFIITAFYWVLLGWNPARLSCICVKIYLHVIMIC